MRNWVFISIVILGSLVIASEMVDGFEVQIDKLDEDGRLINPLKASVDVEDPDNTTITWFLDGKKIGEGLSIQRYVYPGDHNLTIEIEYQNGTTISRSFLLDPLPPPGWDDEPNDRKNRMIFWLIFGSGGLIFAGFAAWIWIKKDEPASKNIDSERLKIQ